MLKSLVFIALFVPALAQAESFGFELSQYLRLEEKGSGQNGKRCWRERECVDGIPRPDGTERSFCRWVRYCE